MIFSKSTAWPDATVHSSLLPSAMWPSTPPRLLTSGVGLNE